MLTCLSPLRVALRLRALQDGREAHKDAQQAAVFRALPDLGGRSIRRQLMSIHFRHDVLCYKGRDLPRADRTGCQLRHSRVFSVTQRKSACGMINPVPWG